MAEFSTSGAWWGKPVIGTADSAFVTKQQVTRADVLALAAPSRVIAAAVLEAHGIT